MPGLLKIKITLMDKTCVCVCVCVCDTQKMRIGHDTKRIEKINCLFTFSFPSSTPCASPAARSCVPWISIHIPNPVAKSTRLGRRWRDTYICTHPYTPYGTKACMYVYTCICLSRGISSYRLASCCSCVIGRLFQKKKLFYYCMQHSMPASHAR